MEPAQSSVETAYYSNVEETRTAKPAGYPLDSYTDPNNYVSKLNGNGNKVGPGIVLRVMSGDKVNIRASSWYYLNGADPGTPVNPLNDLLNVLATGVTTVVTDLGKFTRTELISNGILNPGVGSMLDQQTASYSNTTKPKAYLSWLLLDEQFKLVGSSSGFEQVGADGEFKTWVKSNLPINRNGYLYVYTSNESPVDVFFDNLQVSHIRGPLLEETHYYPFGLTMAGISSKAAGKLENKRKYNGIELNEDLGLNAYEAHFRTLDPAIGRWWQIDPKVDAGYESISPYASMYDDPIRFSDPLGDEGSDDGIFSRAWQNFKNNVSSARDKVVGLFVQAGANLKDNIENGRTLPQQLANDFHENPLSAITGMGALEARAVPFVAREGKLLSTEATGIKSESSAVKTFETYTKEHPNGEVYSGRTSGKAGPEQNVANRDANHHMNEKGFGKAKLDKSSTNKDAIRGREQQLIDNNGRAKSVGGTSGNAINGISDKNPNKAKYIEAAKKEFDKKN